MEKIKDRLAPHLPPQLQAYLDNASAEPALVLKTLLIGVVVLYVGRWVMQYCSVLKQSRGLPKIYSFMEFFESGFRSKVPHVPFFTPRNDLTLNVHGPPACGMLIPEYAKAQTDLIALPQCTTPHAVYITSNPSAAQYISNKPLLFVKPLEMFRYVAINIFGLQIVSAQNGEQHRRHKNVVKGCFGEGVMENVWNKISEAYDVMVKEEGLERGGVMKWADKVVIKTTLLVIGQAGFGIEVPWNIPETSGAILPFPEALEIVERTMIPQLLLPLWLMDVLPLAGPKRWAKAQRSLLHHIKTLASSKRSEITSLREALAVGQKMDAPTDLLGALVASQMDVEATEKLDQGERVGGLTDAEIIGNIWIFIVAGHETTAHTLSFTLAYLALYPEHQEKILKEINEACGDALPTYRDVTAFPYALATLYESIRLRDLVMTLPKVATEDTTIPYTTWDESGTPTSHVYAIKKGSHVIIDSPAAERNPWFWDEPEVFNPARHLTDGVAGVQRKAEATAEDGESKKAKAIFTGFSMGTRQCIGKRFAEVSMISFLVRLVKDFKIHPVPLDGESREKMEERMLKGYEELTFMPGKWDLRLERR